MGNTTIPAELVAINAIQGTLIADNAITAVHIAQNQVHSVQLAINSVTATQIADSTITSAKIADGTIVTADIADGQITTAKLVDSSVTSAKIAAGTIVGGDIANNAILTQHIDDNQITADQIADNAVGLGQMAGLTRGSIIYGDSAGDPAYLAAGTSGHVLTSDGTDISWTADTDLFLASSGGTVTGNITISGGSLTATNAATTIHRLNSTSNNTRSILRLDSKDSSGNSVEIRMHSLGDGPRGEIFTYTNHDLGFATNNAAPQMILKTTGRLGIGEDNPNALVHIGDSAATGNATNPALQIGGASTYRLGMFTTAEGGVIDNANGDDGLQFHTKNVGEAVRITANGNLQMIGQTTSFENPGFTYHTNNYLYLRGGSSGLILSDDSGINTVQIIDGASGYINFETGDGSSRMRIKSDGNVGIGTIQPSEKLEVNGKIRLGGMRLANNDSGRIGLNRNPDDGSTVISGLQRFQINGPYSGGDYLDFQSYNSSGTYTGSFYLSGGKVGIGTSSPGSQLEIRTDTSSSGYGSYPAITIRNDNAAGYGAIHFNEGSTQRARIEVGNNSGSPYLLMNTGTASGQGVYVDSAGEVGIGTTNPVTRLHVVTGGGATPFRVQGGGNVGVNIMEVGYAGGGAGANFIVNDDGYVGIGQTNPESTLHVKGTGQLNLLKIERAASTPGITFINGADTAGTFGFQLMDNDEYWAGVYDGSNYNYWFKGNSSVFRVEKPVASSTDSGTRQYSHLCTGSFYQSTGAIVIDTNIPAHNAGGNANMLSIKIRGFEYAIHGSIDLNVGCYAGENNYYSANYNSNYIAEGWRGNLKFAKNDTTGKMAIILGTTSTVQRCELAVVDFIQGFQNVNESYANGWSMSLKTSLSNYSLQTTMAPRHQSPRPGFHAYLASNTSFTAGTAARLLTQTTFNEGSHYNTSNGRFTAPTEGVYQFNFAFQGQSTSVNQTYVSAEARVNGSTRYIGGWFNKTTGGNNGTNTYSAATGSALIKLSRNDYVEFVCELSNTDSALGGTPGYTYFSGILIG